MTQKEILSWTYRGVKGVDRFWKKVRKGKPNKCWKWTGSTNRGGYGMVRFSDQHIVASRLAWIIVNGDIPDGQYVLHTCDNPPCCNSAHLFLGTYADNNRDAREKGRWTPVCGEKIGTSKLTSSQVRKIRKLFESGGVTKTALGIQFGVTDTMIGNIIFRRWWKNV